LPLDANAAQPLTITATSPNELALGDHLKVTVDGLEAAVQNGLDPATFRLRLDGHRFANVMPERTGANQISFELSGLRNDTEGWLLLAGSPPYTGAKRVKLEIGTSGVDIEGVGGQGVDTTLRIFQPWKLIVSAVIFAAVILVLYYLGARTGMLRDATGAVKLDEAPYSLYRCQMAFWFALILGCFLGLWMVTGEFNNIVSAQSLALMGISSLTAAGAVAIDSAPGRPATQARPKHLSFWKDLLTDDGGWAFHRVQVAVWTIVLGTVSLWSAYSKLTLPAFDSNLLILMGISSGLYLGLKYPEQQSDKPFPENTKAPVAANQPGVGPHGGAPAPAVAP
jgi:hypothetical protein